MTHSRSGVLDAVRAIACVMVVVCHISLYRGDGSLLGLKNGVMLFFALSGYLLYRPFVTGRVDLRRYATHRVARILPAYLAALVGVSILTGDTAFVRQPLTYLLFLQNYDPTLWQGFLGVSWTLVLEVLFYLTLPLLAVLVARSPIRLLALAAMSYAGAILTFGLVAGLDPRLTSSTFPTMIWAFVPGMMAALLEGRMSWARHPAVFLVGIVLLLLGTQVYWASLDLPSALGSFFIVVWAVERRPHLGPFAVPASIGAALTYSAYLWHVDVLKEIGPVPVALIALLTIASAIYLIVERPILTLARRRGAAFGTIPVILAPPGAPSGNQAPSESVR